MDKDIKWTKSYIESLNKRLEKVGLPVLIIDNGYVYKDKMIIKAEDENNLYKDLEYYLSRLVGKRLYKEE